MNSFRHWVDEICYLKGDYEYSMKYRSDEFILAM